MKRQICSYDMLVVPSHSYAVSDEEGEIYFCNSRCLWMILRETSSLALFGITAGLAAAFSLTRFVRTMLFGLQPTDPATFIPAALLLLVIAIAAGYGPARRASRIDPMQALRHE
jgi:ABC-type antimicrobial peptide transport system permease subunit